MLLSKNNCHKATASNSFADQLRCWIPRTNLFRMRQSCIRMPRTKIITMKYMVKLMKVSDFVSYYILLNSSLTKSNYSYCNSAPVMIRLLINWKLVVQQAKIILLDVSKTVPRCFWIWWRQSGGNQFFYVQRDNPTSISGGNQSSSLSWYQSSIKDKWAGGIYMTAKSKKMVVEILECDKDADVNRRLASLPPGQQRRGSASLSKTDR